MSHHWNEDRPGFYAARELSEGAQRTLDERLKDITVRVGEAERLGSFPHGKIGPRDRGQFRYQVTANTAAQIVRVDFGSPVTAVGLTLAEADEMIEAMTAAAWELRGVK